VIEITDCRDQAAKRLLDVTSQGSAPTHTGLTRGHVTPTFFINGRLLSGAQPESSFERIIEEELNQQAKR
jgi:hypothetical protein